MKVTLEKMEKTNNRGIPILGVSVGMKISEDNLDEFPTVKTGEPFFIGKSHTSNVEEILIVKKHYCKFRTMNSIYVLRRVLP